MSVGNTVQKDTPKRYLRDISSIIKNIMLLYSNHVYFTLRNKLKKNVLQNEIKDLLFEVSNPSTLFFFKLFPMRDQAFITSIQKEGEEVLKSVVCLWALLLLNNRSFVNFCKWGWVQGSKN